MQLTEGKRWRYLFHLRLLKYFYILTPKASAIKEIVAKMISSRLKTYALQRYYKNDEIEDIDLKKLRNKI